MSDIDSDFGRIDEIRTTLHIDGQEDDALVVLSFMGVERISEPFSYRVVVGSSNKTAEGLDNALGRDAYFMFQRVHDDSSVHHIHGMIDEVCPSGVAVGKEKRQTVLHIVPRLQELRYKQRCQVFQDMTVVDIAKELLSPWQIEMTARLDREPLKRDYCTQVNETDFDFLRRILSEEGIHFHFEQDDKKAIMVLVSDPRGYQPIAGKQTLPYRDAGGALTTDHIRSIVREQRVRPGSVAYRDYNFLRPTRDMSARNDATEEGMGVLKAREIYAYPGDYNDPNGENIGVPDDVQIPRRSGKARAQLRLEAERSDAFMFSGTTNCLRMQVGRVFEITDHSDESFNLKYTVTQIRISSGDFDRANRTSGEHLAFSFKAAPAETPIRPKVRPKPPAHLRTARVVGPKEDEPYVDEYGRVKIQFAWDREGPLNDKSSCWVRMATPVAHHNQGTYTAHRVGAEVLVDFLDGDVDRPMVTAAVFNYENRQPQKLPDDATRAVLYRGLSVPGNSGNNEISCEDRAGQEEIFVHAQKDLNEHVLHNHTETIGANQTSTVGANQTVSVGANQTINVGANRKVTVGANEDITITKSRTEHVNDHESVTIKNGREHTISTADDKLTVSVGNRIVDVKTKHDIHSKLREERVDTTIDVKAGTSIDLHHEDDVHLKLEANKAKMWTPTASVTIEGGTITLDAADEIKLTCGGAGLSLKKDGTITASGTKEVGLKSADSQLVLVPDKAALSGPFTDVTAVGEMIVNGAIVKIG